MKIMAGLGLISVVLLTACGPSSSTGSQTPATNTAAGGNPLSAPADYLGAAAKSKTVAEKTVDTVSLNQAVQLFYAQEGRFPKDLNELVVEKYLPRLPQAPAGMKITYNASTGEVKVQKQ